MMAESSKGVLLVVDDEPLKRVTLQIELSEAGYTVFEASDARSAMQVVSSNPVDVVISDIRMPGMDGLTLMEQLKAYAPDAHVILMTAYGSVDAAVSAIKRGAYDYVTKPFGTDELLAKIETLLAGRVDSNGNGEQGVKRLGSLIGRSWAARRLFDRIEAVAHNEGPVLICGEAGTCRDRVAETLHQLSCRANEPLNKFSCAGSAPDVLGRELFGSALDATPAMGCIERAGAGTLFLDEIDALSLELQTRLLLALDAGEFDRPGDGQQIAFKARLFCATQADLQQLVDAGRFREDLYYRLDAVCLSIPPLRERREDIPVLATDYLQRLIGSGAPLNVPDRISSRSMDLLVTYHWPGNIRELEHVIERACAFCSGREVEPRDILLPTTSEEVDPKLETPWESGLTETVAGVERSLIDSALRRASGNQAKAAQYLGIPRTTLRDKMTKYGMVGKPVARDIAG